MAPKKREKELDKNRMDHAQADHELFLQAFESTSASYAEHRRFFIFFIIIIEIEFFGFVSVCRDCIYVMIFVLFLTIRTNRIIA